MVPLLVRVRAPAPLVLSGIIWGLWHTPLILFGDYATSGHPAVSALLFMLAIAGAAVSFGWLRLASASVWPAMLIHASHNAWFQSVFDSLTAHSATWGWPRGCWRRGACGPFPRRCSGGSLRGRRVLL
jgi:membrane protease YdiL (CAAX protease family)